MAYAYQAARYLPGQSEFVLAVGPRDGNGYHPLRTVFQAIDLADTLDVEVESRIPGFCCDDASVPGDNTVTRAMALLSEVVRLPPLRITLTKRIPAESGLGGGSSDAAGFLRAAKRLVPGLPEAELLGVAAAVGADVPFFLVGGRARAEGYGERLTPLPDGPLEWLLVVRPDVGCPTGAAYHRLDEQTFPWQSFPEDHTYYNDFARVAPPECLALTARLRELGALDASLAGSGSAVFGRFADETGALAALDQLQLGSQERGWVVRTLARGESLAIRG